LSAAAGQAKSIFLRAQSRGHTAQGRRVGSAGLKKDKHLDALRGREDFQKLVATVESKP
jgi:hypothetical protein